MPHTLTPVARKALKARAHALDPVVIVGDAGLTPGVLAEIDRSLTAHELIKVRVTGDDRDARLALRDRIVSELAAESIQTIGKLLVLYRERPAEDVNPWPVRLAARKTAAKGAAATTRPRFGPAKDSTRKPAKNTHPPRTDRVRKSGQKSAKKAHQDQ